MVHKSMSLEGLSIKHNYYLLNDFLAAKPRLLGPGCRAWESAVPQQLERQYSSMTSRFN